MKNEDLLKLNLSHSVIPRTCMDWNQWFWYTEANENPNITITLKYLKMETKTQETRVDDESSWKDTVIMCYAIGTLVLSGLFGILSVLIPYLMYEH